MGSGGGGTGGSSGGGLVGGLWKRSAPGGGFSSADYTLSFTGSEMSGNVTYTDDHKSTGGGIL
jgi:hypothetical protein